MVRPRILILGAGLQGVCAALALSARGFPVTVVDEAEDCLLRTSLRNEGKIHLGLVYAHDPSFRTAGLMLRSSVAFAPLLEEWIGGAIDWHAMRSAPFRYVIARDSMLPPEALFAHYERLQEEYAALRREGASYLGAQPERLWHEANGNARFRGAQTEIETAEVALDLAPFRDLLRMHLRRQPATTLLYGHRLESLERTSTGYRAEGVRRDGTVWRVESDLVVNSLWADRLRIDQQVSSLPRRRWIQRLKYRVLAWLPDELRALPSMTMVLGQYGDVVVYRSGLAYFSWYPVCRRDSSDAVTTPAAWAGPCRGEPDPEEARWVASETLRALDTFAPGVTRSRVETVDGGVIIAWGQADIDDPSSELHERFDVGVHADGGYYSIDTGKLTCAPYFAQALADRVESDLA